MRFNQSRINFAVRLIIKANFPKPRSSPNNNDSQINENLAPLAQITEVTIDSLPFSQLNYLFLPWLANKQICNMGQPNNLTRTQIKFTGPIVTHDPLRLPCYFVFFHRRDFSGIPQNSKQKNILQAIEPIHFSVLISLSFRYKRNVFWSILFLNKSFAVQRNSPEHCNHERLQPWTKYFREALVFMSCQFVIVNP